MPRRFHSRDINSLTDLRSYRGRVVKYSTDGGKTWKYARICDTRLEEFQNRSGPGTFLGQRANRAVSRDGALGIMAFSQQDFDQGMLVRLPATAETKGMKFSYE